MERHIFQPGIGRAVTMKRMKKMAKVTVKHKERKKTELGHGNTYSWVGHNIFASVHTNARSLPSEIFINNLFDHRSRSCLMPSKTGTLTRDQNKIPRTVFANRQKL